VNVVDDAARPARGATLMDCAAMCSDSVSIHAPRAGRDDHGLPVLGSIVVSIHAPRAGRDSL